MIPSLSEIRLSDVLDIAIVAGLLWLTIAWLQQTRTRLALLGLAILGALYFVVQQLQFQLTTWLLQGFFAVVVLVVVVVFQDDLRRLFERIAVVGLRRQPPRSAPDVTEILVRCASELSQQRRGALVVLPGREPLQRHIEGGVHLKGRLSAPLLLSLFDPHSPGHDGAVVVQGHLVSRFGGHLPLSSDWDKLGSRGTRHAAALGLAERTDALCLVVSEERGTLAVAHEGELRVLAGPEALAGELRRFAAKLAPRSEGRRTRLQLASLARRWAEGLVAFAVAAGLWLVTVPGSTVSQSTRSVPVVIDNLPAGYDLVSVEPPDVEVVLEGRRRDLYLANASPVRVHIDALLVQLGRRTFEIDAEQVSRPSALQIAAVTPDKVRLAVKREPETGTP